MTRTERQEFEREFNAPAPLVIPKVMPACKGIFVEAIRTLPDAMEAEDWERVLDLLNLATRYGYAFLYVLDQEGAVEKSKSEQAGLSSEAKTKESNG